MRDIPEPTAEVSAELSKKLKKLYSEADTTVIREIKEFQMSHLDYLNKNYFPFRQSFEMYFSMLVDVSLNVNYLDKKKWPINRGFQFVIATHSLKQFYSAYELFCDGFYEDSIALLRSVYESFLRILYVSCNPKTPYNAYTTKGETGAKFNAKGFVKDELGLDWANYNIMSAFAHSNKYAVINEMVDNIKNGQKEAVSLKYSKDDDMISVVVNYFLFLLVTFLKLFDEVFVVDYDKHEDKVKLAKHYKLLSDYADAASLMLKTHSVNKYWRGVGYEIDELFALMRVMDNNPEAVWKKEWAKIR